MKRKNVKPAVSQMNPVILDALLAVELLDD